MNCIERFCGNFGDEDSSLETDLLSGDYLSSLISECIELRIVSLLLSRFTFLSGEERSISSFKIFPGYFIYLLGKAYTIIALLHRYRSMTSFSHSKVLY